MKWNERGYRKQNIKDGDKLLESATSQVLELKTPINLMQKALSHYYVAQKFNPNNSELNYKIAKCLLYTNQKEKALNYINHARKLNGELPSEALFYYGIGLQLSRKYEEAIKIYKKLLVSEDLINALIIDLRVSNQIIVTNKNEWI